MSRSVACGASAFALSLIVLAACVGDDPSVSGGGTGADSGQNDGSSGATGDAGSSGTVTCKGDTIDACGASCTKCTAPTGGTAVCSAGACQKKCDAPQTLCGDACTDTST